MKILISVLMFMSSTSFGSELSDNFKKTVWMMISRDQSTDLLRYSESNKEMKDVMSLVASTGDILRDSKVHSKIKDILKTDNSVTIYNCVGLNVTLLFGGKIGQCTGVEISRAGTIRMTSYSQYSIAAALGVEVAQYEAQNVKGNGVLENLNTEISFGTGITYVKRLAVDWYSLKFGRNGRSHTVLSGNTGWGIGHTFIDVESVFNIPSNNILALQLSDNYMRSLDLN